MMTIQINGNGEIKQEVRQVQTRVRKPKTSFIGNVLKYCLAKGVQRTSQYIARKTGEKAQAYKSRIKYARGF